MKDFINKHKTEIIGVTCFTIGVVGTILITKKIHGSASFSNNVTLKFDNYIPGFNSVKDVPINGCFAVVSYDDGVVDIIDDIEGLAKRLAK
jgi:hypothetical protein